MTERYVVTGDANVSDAPVEVQKINTETNKDIKPANQIDKTGVGVEEQEDDANESESLKSD